MELSKNEKRLYDLIPPRGKRIDSDTLTKNFYGSGVPINGRVYVANLIRSLRRKWPHVPDMKQVVSTTGSGRKAIEVWLLPRNAEGFVDDETA